MEVEGVSQTETDDQMSCLDAINTWAYVQTIAVVWANQAGKKIIFWVL